MSGLIKRAPRASAVSTESVSGVVRSSKSSFSKEGVFIEDFLHLLSPQESQPTARLIAESISQQDNRSALRRNGQLFQRKQAWRATVESLTIWTFLRPLAKQTSGVLKPSGPWFLDDEKKYSYTSTPTRRHGVISYAGDRVVEENDTAQQDASGPTVTHEPYVLSYLPSVVQNYAVNQVSQPTFSHGEIWQWADSSGIPYKQSLEALRMDEETAVVITAVKEISPYGHDPDAAADQLANTPWTVTQSLLKLSKSKGMTEIGR